MNTDPAMKIYIWRTTAMVVFRGLFSPMHEHIAAQLAIAGGGQARVQAEDGAWLEGPAILVPQGIPHAYDARVGVQLVLWIEPASLAGRAISARYSDTEVHVIDEDAILALREKIPRLDDASFGPDEATALRDEIIERLTGELPRPIGRIDPRLMRALDVLYEHRDRDLSVGDLADRLDISESHLSHLFSEQIGVPVSRYRMWLRVLEASRRFGRGETITAAAHGAGFADGAHLSRTFKLLMGQSPSTAQDLTLELHAIDEEVRSGR